MKQPTTARKPLIKYVPGFLGQPFPSGLRNDFAGLESYCQHLFFLRRVRLLVHPLRPIVTLRDKTRSKSIYSRIPSKEIVCLPRSAGIFSEAECYLQKFSGSLEIETRSSERNFEAVLAGRPKILLIGHRLMTDHAGFPRWTGYRGD
jgi:hypothetical protein